MGNKVNTTESAGSATSAVDDVQNPEEATVIMDTADVEPLQDDDATVVMGDVNVSGEGE